MRLLTPVLLAATLMTATAAPAFAGPYEDAMDRFMITELMYRYALMHNESDIEGWANLFTDDAVLYDQTMGFTYAKGRAEIIEQAKKDRAKYNPAAATATPTEGKLQLMSIRHNITDPVVTLNPDGTASGVCYVQIVGNQPGVGPIVLAQGYYKDQYVKKNGKWLFSRRDLNAMEWSNWGAAKTLGFINGPLPPGVKP
jgi:hypothetical protein